MKFFLILYAITLIFTKVKADIKDFIIEDEHALHRLEAVDEPFEEETEHSAEMFEHDTCGYETPAQKYLYDHHNGDEVHEDDVTLIGALTKNNAIEALKNMMKEQKISLNYIQQIFAQMNTNPKYAEIFKQVMSEEQFIDQPSCSNSHGLDVFSSPYGGEELKI